MNAPLPSNEEARLAALKQYSILDTHAEQAYDDLIFLASTICEAPISLMTLVDEERQWFKAKTGIELTQTPREHAFCAHTILQTVPLIVSDAEHDTRFADNPLVTGATHIRFYAGVPLINPDGHALGSLCVIDRKPRLPSKTQVKALEALARQIMTQLELRRVSAVLAKQLSKVKTLHGLLPICSFCKGIRDDKGYWVKVEEYIKAHTDVNFSHGICRACSERHYPQLFEKSPSTVS